MRGGFTRLWRFSILLLRATHRRLRLTLCARAFSVGCYSPKVCQSQGLRTTNPPGFLADDLSALPTTDTGNGPQL